MHNTKKKLNLPTIDIDYSDIDNLTIVNPIDFISKQENEHILEILKQGLRDANNPNKWMTWEEYEDLEKENGFF